MIEAYEELLKVLEKYEEVLTLNNNLPSTTRVEGWIEAYNIQEKFGIPFSDLDSSYGSWYKVKGDRRDIMNIGLFGDKIYNRSITGLPVDKQPKNEWLLMIRFSTGPYIFHECYPENVFSEFFNALVNIGAKYVDWYNNAVYFDPINAKTAYEACYPLFEKYKGMVGSEIKQQRKLELEAELAKLNEELS